MPQRRGGQPPRGGRRSGGSGPPPREREEHKIVWGWPLPSDVRQALRPGIHNDPKELWKEFENLGLLLHRYVPYPKEGPKTASDEDIFNGAMATWDWQKKKADIWKAMEGNLSSLYANNKPSSKLLQGCLQRLNKVEAAVSQQCFKIRSFSVNVQWRLVIGLGLPTPLEVGITLHHLYGFPYLPGSAIKGVTRSWQLQHIADELGIPRLSAQHIDAWKKGKDFGATPWERLERLLMSPVPDKPDGDEQQGRFQKNLKSRWENLQKALKDERLQTLKDWGYFNEDPRLPNLKQLKRQYIQDFSRAFGSTEAKSEIIFFDAYPEALMVKTPSSDEKPILELDVMNPHYGKYYDGTEPPADWLSPVPVFFLVVRQGTLFTIKLASQDQNLLGTVEGWAKAALREFGIGAKTRAGYGELCEASAKPAAQREKVGSPAASAATPADDSTATLQAAIERWTPREMGNIRQLVESITQVAEESRQRELAQQLQQKLKEAGKWGRNYRSSPWHQQLEQILGEGLNS